MKQGRDLTLLIAIDARGVDRYKNIICHHNIGLSCNFKIRHRRDEDFILPWKLRYKGQRAAAVDVAKLALKNYGEGLASNVAHCQFLLRRCRHEGCQRACLITLAYLQLFGTVVLRAATLKNQQTRTEFNATTTPSFFFVQKLGRQSDTPHPAVNMSSGNATGTRDLTHST